MTYTYYNDDTEKEETEESVSTGESVSGEGIVEETEQSEPLPEPEPESEPKPKRGIGLNQERRYRRAVFLRSYDYAPYWDIIRVIVAPSERLTVTEMNELIDEYLATPLF